MPAKSLKFVYHYNTQVKGVSNSFVTCGPLSDDCHYKLLCGLLATSLNSVTQLQIQLVAMTHAVDFIECDIGKNASVEVSMVYIEHSCLSQPPVLYNLSLPLATQLAIIIQQISCFLACQLNSLSLDVMGIMQVGGRAIINLILVVKVVTWYSSHICAQ